MESFALSKVKFDGDIFKEVFLANYLKLGMGAMGKRDIDVLVMFIIDNYGKIEGKFFRGASNNEASRILQIPESRLKSLRYEAALKYSNNSDMFAKVYLLYVLSKARFESGTKNGKGAGQVYH